MDSFVEICWNLNQLRDYFFFGRFCTMKSFDYKYAEFFLYGHPQSSSESQRNGFGDNQIFLLFFHQESLSSLTLPNDIDYPSKIPKTQLWVYEDI